MKLGYLVELHVCFSSIVEPSAFHPTPHFVHVKEHHPKIPRQVKPVDDSLFSAKASTLAKHSTLLSLRLICELSSVKLTITIMERIK